MINDNPFGSPSNEREIEAAFLRDIYLEEKSLTRTAQAVPLAPDEAAGANDALADIEKDPIDTPAGGPQDAAGEALPDLDTDEDEMNAIKSLIPWDSFSINFDPHYSKRLETTLGLPPTKAKAKSFYIYFAPENKRIEGVVNKRYIGGYGTKEDMGEDFTFIKELSPEGFSPEWKEKLLEDIDETPAVENSMIAEQLKQKAKEVTEEEPEEEGQPKQQIEPTPGPGNQTQEQAPPQPVGKVDTNSLPKGAAYKSIVMRRMARARMLKNI